MDLVQGSEESTCRAIDKLVSLLVEKERLLRGIKISEVESLIKELKMIRDFLRYAEARSEEEELSDAVKERLNESKEVAELIEDVVDKHIVKTSQGGHPSGFVSFLGRVGRLIGTLNNRHDLSSDIRNIKELLRQIQERGQIYSMSGRLFNKRPVIARRYKDRLMNPHFLQSTVGIDSAADELIQRLLEGVSERSVVSLAGIGGIGKTTLAKIVYDNEVVRGHFDCLAWITATSTGDLNMLIRNMVWQIGAEGNHGVRAVERMRHEELIDMLSRYLQSKRYLVVFDDVDSIEFWPVMKQSLPDNDKGSRVIITTRHDEIAAYCKESSFDHVHRLEPLSAAMSRDLFCSRVFRHEHEQSCPPELEQLSHKFVSMCGGLPLAIVVLAGLLSTKEKTVLEWQRLLDSFNLISNPDLPDVSRILALSFRDLPSHLKSCFLYFSIFPKQSLIPNDKLFNLWIAEGFVRGRKRNNYEEVAEKYLNELIQRNLVEACEEFYGLEKFCRHHDLMHEIAQQKADELSFCQVRNGENSSFGGKSRRLSMSNKIEANVLETIADYQVHSVFLSNLSALNNSFLVKLFGRHTVLKLLDFEKVSLDHLPEEVGNLFYLKYLSLKNTKVKRLPKSVGKLENLLTLDLRNTLLVELPVEINRLRKLRHLLASGYKGNIGSDSTQGVWIKQGIGFLENLHTLLTVEANLSGNHVIQELCMLRKLRRLSISGLTTELSIVLSRCLTELRQLESLSLRSVNDSEFLDLEDISSAPLFLQRLVLKGRLQRLPNWISSLQYLSMLCLSLSRLTDEPLRHISQLPNLVSLWLYRAYEGEQLRFALGGFHKLKLLVLRDLQRLEVVDIEEGALSLLEELRI